uniref:Inosine/uridine-preferring nucleoside hydrolase domain-containing protein n=1 Tax=Leptobrachium leishanense TaxID=445787 RepID=A0A8C5MSY2_9ANUR
MKPLSSSPTAMSCKKKLLIDVDCGTDDAQAIMMAISAPNVKIMGITCVGGNTSLDNVCKNVLRVLKVCDRSDIPVYKGASKSILGDSIHASYFHGVDGLGDVPDPNAPGLEGIQKEHAVDAIRRLISKNPGEIALVATGPLTNLALAVKMDPTISGKLKCLYIMGGNMESRGNTTACGEFNFLADPEGAYIVCNEFLCKTYIATWEFACRHKLSWEWYDNWVNSGTKKADFIKKIYAHSLQYSRSEKEVKGMVTGPGFVSCDSYAMAAAIDESTVKDVIECAVTVETGGRFARGMMVLDMIDDLKKEHKALVMNKVDMEKFERLMKDSVK